MTPEPYDEEFETLIERMRTIYYAKNHDYTGGSGKLANFELAEQIGVPMHKGIIIRMSDKISRISSFIKTQIYKVENESVEDTLIDLANYSLLCIMAYNQNRGSLKHNKMILMYKWNNLTKIIRRNK